MKHLVYTPYTTYFIQNMLKSVHVDNIVYKLLNHRIWRLFTARYVGTQQCVKYKRK